MKVRCNDRNIRLFLVTDNKDCAVEVMEIPQCLSHGADDPGDKTSMINQIN